jgi:Xaa-Pro aminopeptidase
MPYRQDSDFYYLTGWNEPGAALMIVSDAPHAASPRAYKEILVPARAQSAHGKVHRRQDGCGHSGVEQASGVDHVEPMAELPAELNQLIAADRTLYANLWTQPDSPAPKPCLALSASRWEHRPFPPSHDVTSQIMPLRQVKDDGEIELIKKASAASILAQRVMMQWWVKPGMTERAIAGAMTAVWMENGCERPSYAPIVGSGVNSTTCTTPPTTAPCRTATSPRRRGLRVFHVRRRHHPHRSCERPLHRRQREIYNIVLGAQQAAIDAFVAGKSTINDRDRQDPNSLDTVPTTTSTPTEKTCTASPRPILAARAGPHDGHRCARSRQLPRGAQAGNGLHHRAGYLHSRGKARRAHRVRFPGGRRRQVDRS